MSNYTKTVNFATKDNLSPGNPLKIVKGTEIDTEYNNIATAVATKTDNSAAAITGGTITGITDLAVADGGTGASTAAAALNNLLPSQTSNASKYLQTDGTNASWDAVSLSTADITGTLAVANGGTGVTSSTGTVAVVLSNSPTLITPALGTPSAAVLTNATNLPISTGVSGLGTGVATLLATPSSANLASAITDETGSGSLVFATSPTLVTPILGTPTSGTLTNATGLPISTGVSGLGTGVATFLATPSSANLISAVTDETGTGSLVFATSPTLVTPALGTPTSGVATNLTGLPLTTGVTGLLPVANGGTATATPSIVAGTNITVTGTWPNQTITASGGSGSVTSVSVVSANGFAGTVATATSTPAITVSTSITGVLKGNGTAISAATAGTDYVTPTGTETLTNKTIAYGSNTLTDVVGVTATQTLTNKTLTAPIISSISNTGTLTLPTSTDTLVGRATTDTLTNKTLTSPTLTTPQLGTPSQGVLSSCTVDGTNKVGYQNIPLSGIKTASYTLVAGDVGKFVELGTSGTIVVPASVFATGDVISIFNNTSASISCTCSAITDFYKGGTDTDISTFSVTTRGVATILFITATRAVVTGNLA